MASIDTPEESARWSLLGAHVVSGLFKFDLGNGFGFDRRQLALVANFNKRNNSFLNIAALSVSSDLNTLSLIGSELSVPYPSNNTLTSHVSLVAGGFTGNGDIKNPLWSLAVGAWVVPSIFDLRVVKVGASGLSVAFEKRYTQPVLAEFGRFPLVAYDTDGDSVYLGAPVHFTISDLIRPQVIFQEPPKHTAYLGKQVVNVSRLHDFYVELKDSKGTTFASTTTDTTDWNIGGSLDISAKASLEVGDIEKTGAKGTIEGSLKIGYDYEGHKEDYNSGYASNTLTFTGQTIADDLLVADLQTFDVWRYRAFGVSPTDTQGRPLNGFYELVLPGPKVEARGGDYPSTGINPCMRTATSSVRLRKGAIAAIDAKRGTLFTDAVDAYLDRPLRIRVHVETDMSDSQQYHLLVYKGNPKQGAEVIADKLLQGVDAEDGKYVWVEWTPSELGNVTLHAQLLEQEDDVIPGNAKKVLKVRVKPAPKGR